MRKWIAGLTAAVVLAVATVAVSISTPASQAITPPPQVTICHSTSSHSNPYVNNTVDDDAVNGGNAHQNHNGGIYPANPWGDIIPPFDVNNNIHGGGSKNWTPAGQAIWSNRCNLIPPTATATATPTNTPTATAADATSPTATNTPTNTPTVTATASDTSTNTPEPTNAATTPPPSTVTATTVIVATLTPLTPATQSTSTLVPPVSVTPVLRLPDTGNGGYLADTVITERYFLSWRQIVAGTLGTAIIILSIAIIISAVKTARYECGDEDDDPEE